LSDNEPAAQLSATYDHAQGWYAGAFVSTAESGYYQTQGVQAIGFGGYASRLPSGLTLEAGADYTTVTTTPRFDYPEVYAGFAFQNVSGRVYYSPRYFGQDSAAVYGELNLTHPVRDDVHLVAHIGVLGSHAKPGYGPSSGTAVDGAVGVSVLWNGFTVQASWIGINHASTAYAVTGTGNKNGVVASLSHAF